MSDSATCPISCAHSIGRLRCRREAFVGPQKGTAGPADHRRYARIYRSTNSNLYAILATTIGDCFASLAMTRGFALTTRGLSLRAAERRSNLVPHSASPG